LTSCLAYPFLLGAIEKKKSEQSSRTDTPTPCSLLCAPSWSLLNPSAGARNGKGWETENATGSRRSGRKRDACRRKAGEKAGQRKRTGTKAASPNDDRFRSSLCPASSRKLVASLCFCAFATHLFPSLLSTHPPLPCSPPQCHLFWRLKILTTIDWKRGAICAAFSLLTATCTPLPFF